VPDASAAAASAVTAFDVRQYGAKGNGSDNDTAAIQAAFDDVPTGGGAVFFPPGDFLVSASLRPKARTMMFGCHTPQWDVRETLPSACRIRVGPGFAGRALVDAPKSAVAVTIRNLALVGAGVGSGIDGIRFPSASEASWCLEDVSIVGFTGDGLSGRMHVGSLSRCWVAGCRGWGVRATDEPWLDVHATDCFFYGNRQGNLLFGGSAESGAVDFVNCRFERAGFDPGKLFSPPNPAAPGVRISSGYNIQFVNCNTDANTGDGFQIVHDEVSPPYQPHHIALTSCRFTRDGTGANGSTLEDFTGLRVAGSDPSTGAVAMVTCANCTVSYGKAADDGSGTVVGPKYGVWYENTVGFQWLGGDVMASPDLEANEFYSRRGGNRRESIWLGRRGLLSLPVVKPDGRLPIPQGAAWVDTSAGRLHIRVGDVWRTVVLG
jgi:hypothetical protein